MMKVVAIINPVSGVVSKKRIPMLLSRVLPEGRFQTACVFSEYHGHAHELAAQAVKGNADCVLAVGGDGTVNEVAKALIHTPATLGIVPMGSGNGLARDLAIPLDTRKALEVIVDGCMTKIDYCKANEHIFFCTCGVGFDALVSERFAEEKRRGPLAYLKSVITEYLNYEPDSYEITIENEVLAKSAFLVTCANASQYGNNAFIAPHASMNDGMMDIVILLPFTPLDVGPLVVQLFTRQMEKNSKTEYYRAKKITLKKGKAGIMHLDGEPVQMGDRVTIEAFREGLRVFVPRDPLPPVYDVPSFFSYITRWIMNK
jgi:YegS/Rv2252/BmrU family lipid kinase